MRLIINKLIKDKIIKDKLLNNKQINNKQITKQLTKQLNHFFPNLFKKVNNCYLIKKPLNHKMT